MPGLRDLGKCVIFSTHIMREVEKLCDRIAIIHRGTILDEGTLDELRERHHEQDFEELFFQLLSHGKHAIHVDTEPLPVTLPHHQHLGG